MPCRLSRQAAGARCVILGIVYFRDHLQPSRLHAAHDEMLGRLLPVLVAALLLPAAFAGSPQVLRGHLQSAAGPPSGPNGPLVLLAEQGNPYPVSGDSITNAQLRDPRLHDRLWELEGELQPDGHFEIRRLYTIKDGKRHRVTYYCEVCHIRTYQPGPCMCCQDETELQEIPVTE